MRSDHRVSPQIDIAGAIGVDVLGRYRNHRSGSRYQLDYAAQPRLRMGVRGDSGCLARGTTREVVREAFPKVTLLSIRSLIESSMTCFDRNGALSVRQWESDPCLDSLRWGSCKVTNMTALISFRIAAGDSENAAPGFGNQWPQSRFVGAVILEQALSNCSG